MHPPPLQILTPIPRRRRLSRSPIQHIVINTPPLLFERSQDACNAIDKNGSCFLLKQVTYD